MTDESFGTLKVANEYLDDYERLNAQYLEEGYLFLRGILDLEAVLRVKCDFIGVFQEQGVVKPGESEPTWTGVKIDQIDDNALYALDSHASLLQSQQTHQFIAKVLGEPAFISPGTNIRYSLPGDDRHVTPPHQDHFFIQQTTDFRTLWVPLMDIDERIGPLAVAVGSHKHGLLEHVEHKTAYSYMLKGRKQKGVPLEEVQHTWSTIDYRPGDVLVFHSLTIHRALPNRSDRVRLSLDTRCLPQSRPRMWQLEGTMLEIRHYRKEVQRLAAEAGAGQEQFEVMVIEMMKRGLPAEQEPVEALLAEISAH